MRVWGVNSKHNGSHTSEGNISSIFSNNSGADASELFENIEEVFSRYYMANVIQYLTTHWYVTRRKRVKPYLKICQTHTKLK